MSASRDDDDGEADFDVAHHLDWVRFLAAITGIWEWGHLDAALCWTVGDDQPEGGSRWVDTIRTAKNPAMAFARHSEEIMSAWSAQKRGDAAQIAARLFDLLGSPARYKLAAATIWVDTCFPLLLMEAWIAGSPPSTGRSASRATLRSFSGPTIQWPRSRNGV